MAGCVTIAERPLEPGEEVITFTEEGSVDPALRAEFNEATRLLREERYEEAIAILDKVVQVSQQNSAPYINMALAYRKGGRLEEAESALEKAMQINPRHPATLNEYALLYRETGRYAEARALYQSLVELYPQFTPARKNFGILCELYLDDAACATIHYEAYLEMRPDDEDVRLWLKGLQQ